MTEVRERVASAHRRRRRRSRRQTSRRRCRLARVRECERRQTSFYAHRRRRRRRSNFGCSRRARVRCGAARARDALQKRIERRRFVVSARARRHPKVDHHHDRPSMADGDVIDRGEFRFCSPLYARVCRRLLINHTHRRVRPRVRQRARASQLQSIFVRKSNKESDIRAPTFAPFVAGRQLHTDARARFLHFFAQRQQAKVCAHRALKKL